MYRRPTSKPHDGGSPRPHDGGMADASSSKHKSGGTPGTTSKGKVAKRLLSYHVEEHPMTALEYFIYVFTVLFVGVFVGMQIVFMVKLYRFERSNDEVSLQGKCNASAALTMTTTDSAGEQQQLQLHSEAFPISDGRNNNRIRIEIMANQTRRKALTKWPPLDAIVDPKDGSMIGNPQFLLDFAVIGFEKCGTYSTLVCF